MKSKRKRLFEIIEIGNTQDRVSRGFDWLLVVVIVMNIVAMFMETFEQFQNIKWLLDTIETVTVAFFIVEYVLRIATADYLYPGRSRGEAILKFVFSFDGIVELLTILPFFFLSGMVVFRMLRVVRIFRLFRVNAYTDSFNVIIGVIKEKKNQILSSVFIVLVLMFASSLCMYSAEHQAQPDVFRNAFSGIWWSMSTLLTIGYGDIAPVTILGKLMGIIIAFLGVGAVAIPTGIISAGFVEQYTEAQNSDRAAYGINLQTLSVDMDSRWIGKSVEDIDREYGVIIVMAKRGDATIVPGNEYAVAVGDTLVVYK